MVATLQVIGSRQMGGAETFFLRLCAAFVASGHRTEAIVRPGSELASKLPPNVGAHTLGLSNYFDIRSALKMRALARECHVDVVQSWMSRATWLTRVPRGMVHVARIGGYYRPRYFRHAHGWVVNTSALRDWMIQAGFPSDRAICIHNFLPTSTMGAVPPVMRAELDIPEGAFVIGAMGRCIPKKGFDDLIDAFGQLEESIGGRPTHLLLMGDGPMLEALRKQAKPFGDRAHLTGWVDQPVAALPLMDVFVCPSHEEAFGNVMMEAWSCGLPVVSTRTDGGLELIQDGNNGLLCDIGDREGLRQCISRILGNKLLREHLAGCGRELFLKRHHPDASIKQYLEFYALLKRRFA